MLWASALLVFGTLAWVVTSLQPGSELPFGVGQLIHARIPWLLLGVLWLGGALGLGAVLRGRPTRWLAVPVVGVELVLVALVSLYVLKGSWLPEHELALGVGDAFPSYSLVDQDGRIHTFEEGDARRPALYVFYRGDW
jgi:hypothetical protein